MEALILVLYSCIYLLLLFLERLYNPLKIIKKNKITKIKYYRDELDYYSPLINAKILGKNIFDQDVIVSMILYLEEKQKNNEISKLMPHEKEFIEKKKFIFHDLKNKVNTAYLDATLKRHIEDLIEDDMKSLSLIDNSYKENTGYLKKTDILTFLLFMVNIICTLMITNSIIYPKSLLTFIFVFELIVNLTWITIYEVSISLNLIFKMNLTENGRIYCEKLNASKKFLKDFSLIGKRTIIEEKLWGSYIRNSIFFNLKGKLDEDAKKYYKQIISKYEYKENYKLKINKLINILGTIIIFGPWYVLLLLLLLGNKSMDSLFFILILFNFIINPFVFFYFVNKYNPSSDRS